jgi:hypothetical protein
MHSKWDNGSIWKRGRAATMDLTIDATRGFRDCGAGSPSKVQSDDCNDCYELLERVNVFSPYWYTSSIRDGRHCDGDVVGDFEKVKNVTITENGVEVDFECCN